MVETTTDSRQSETTWQPGAEHGGSVAPASHGAFADPIMHRSRSRAKDSFGGSTADSVSPGRRPPWGAISFILLVLIPSLLSFVYFVGIASDQYTAEARFTVRSLADASDGPMPGQGLGLLNMQAAPQDAFVVKSFIQSEELLRRLRSQIDFRAMFSLDSADPLSRFNPKDTDTQFLDYWKDHVSAYIDGPSGIVTLTVRTFRPADSLALADAIVGESEKLVNEMSGRAKKDLLKSFSEEVVRTGALYQNALADLRNFQQSSGVLRPEMQAKGAGTLLTGLIAQKLELESRLFVLRQSNSIDSPTYNQMRIADDGINRQIADLQARLAGSSDTSLASTMTEFSRLDTARLVAEKLYEAAQNNYNSALAEISRKTLYLSVFVRPTLPDKAIYPKRIMNPIMIFLGLFVSWATLALIWASVEDHRL